MHALTFLEETVLLADGMGFWVAMDWIVLALGLSGEEHRKGTPTLLLQNALASIILSLSLLFSVGFHFSMTRAKKKLRATQTE